jgi:hypothetical protein
VWSTTTFYGSQATISADVNGDGKADLVAVNGWATWVMLSDGSGYGAPQPWSMGSASGSHGTFAADVNGDGRVDLVAVNGNSAVVSPASGPSFDPPAIWFAHQMVSTRAIL